MEEYSEVILSVDSDVAMDDEVLCPECDPADEEVDDDLIVNEAVRGAFVHQTVGYPSNLHEVIRSVHSSPRRIFGRYLQDAPF